MKTISQPTVQKLPANQRGQTEIAWLHSRHSFSFGEYFDPNFMGFRTLRVINDDVVEPSMGFGSHPHRNMEIMTYVIDGELQHKDSMGHGEVIRAGEFQYMRAGKGVVHSEFNASHEKNVHLLQIWMLPRTPGGEPRYGQLSTRTDVNPPALRLLASGTEQPGAITIEQDAQVYLGRVKTGESVTHHLGADRGAWVQLIKGELAVEGETLQPGDGLAVENAESLTLSAQADAEFLLFAMD